MDISFVDISKSNKLSPKSGRLLLAEPFMLDDHFSRSVIYLCEHNKDGSYGFILNNTLNLKLNDIITDKELPDIDVFLRRTRSCYKLILYTSNGKCY